MDTVANEARGEALVGKGHADNAWLPGAHGGHRIEEVRHAAQSLLDRPRHSAGADRNAITDGHDLITQHGASNGVVDL